MSEEEILAKINKLKIRVTEIVQAIQQLKKQLEQAAIPLDEFKSRKTILEQELREILKQIAQVKQRTDIIPHERVEEPIDVSEVPLIEEVSVEKKKETSQLIDKEILFAQEAKDLMYYFQAEFIDSVTNAKVYLSITVDEHFIIGIDYSNYPQKPKLDIPPEILKLFDDDENEFYENIPSNLNWDAENPKKIYELITEVETVLINKFQADIKTIEKKSVEHIENTKRIMEDLIKEAQEEVEKKDLQKAINLYYGIIELAYDINDYEGVEKHTNKLNELLKKRGN